MKGLSYLDYWRRAGPVIGTPSIDGADLEQKLTRYLGTDGAVRSPTSVTVQGKKILVVVVERPRWGGHIHALKNSHDTAVVGPRMAVARLERYKPTISSFGTSRSACRLDRAPPWRAAGPSAR